MTGPLGIRKDLDQNKTIDLFIHSYNNWGKISLRRYGGKNEHRLEIVSGDDGDSDYILFRNFHWKYGYRDLLSLKRSRMDVYVPGYMKSLKVNNEFRIGTNTLIKEEANNLLIMPKNNQLNLWNGSWSYLYTGPLTVNGNITANGDVQIFGRLLDKDGKEMIKQQTIEGKEVMVIEKETVIEKGMKVKDKIVIGEGTTVLSGTELYLSSELPKITLKDGYETKIWAGGVSPTTLPPYAEYGKLNFLAPGGFVFYNPDSNSPGIKIMDSNGEAYLQITHDGENYAIYKTSGSKGGHVFDKKITVGDIMGENSVITDNSVTCKNLRVKNKIYGPKPEGEPRVIIGDLLVAEKGINIPSGYKITGDGGGLKNVSAIYSKDSDKLDGKDSSFYLNTSATAQTKSGDLGIKGNLTVEGDLEVKGKINGTATNSERWDNLEYGVKFSRPARSPKTWYKNGPRIRFVSVTVWDPDSHDHQFKIKSPGGEKYTIFSIWMKGGHGGTVCGFVPPGWYYKVDSNAKWPRVWNWTEIDIGK